MESEKARRRLKPHSALRDWIFEAAAIIVSGNHLRAHGCIGWQGETISTAAAAAKGGKRGRWRKKKLQQGVGEHVDRTDNQ